MLWVECLRFGCGLPLSGSANSSTNRIYSNSKPSAATQFFIQSGEECFVLNAYALAVGYPCPGLQIARPRAVRRCKSIKRSFRLQTFGLCLGYPCPGPQIAWPRAGRRCKASKKVLGYKLWVYAWATPAYANSSGY